MPDSTFFEFTEGAFPDGTPRPLKQITLEVGIPTVVQGNIVRATDTLVIDPAPKLSDKVEVRIVPDTRLVEVGNPLIANALQSHPHYREVDPPKKSEIDKQVSEHADDAKRAAALGDIAAEQEETAAPSGAVSVPADVPTNEPQEEQS